MMPSNGVVPSRRSPVTRTLRSSQPVLITFQVRPLSVVSNTLLDDAPVASTRWFPRSTSMWATLERRSEVIRFQVSPRSVLRKMPSRAASQMVPAPLLSTETELMMKSGSRGFGLSQLSPPFTETAMAFLPVTTTILSADAIEVMYGTDKSCFRQFCPASSLVKSPADVAAYQRSEVVSSPTTLGNRDDRLPSGEPVRFF